MTMRLDTPQPLPAQARYPCGRYEPQDQRIAFIVVWEAGHPHPEGYRCAASLRGGRLRDPTQAA